MPRRRIDRRRRRRAEQRAGKVRADDEVLLEIDPLAVADQPVPPPRPLVLAVACTSPRVRARGERVADEDGVRLVGVQLAERLVPDRERRDRLAVREAEAVLEHELLRRRGDERAMNASACIEAREGVSLLLASRFNCPS